jgi:pimeloyl-ACP methyl ester carboxylesterase
VDRTAVSGHGAAGEKTELPALALPRSGSRVCGVTRTLSAVRSPVGLHCFDDANTVRAYGTGLRGSVACGTAADRAARGILRYDWGMQIEARGLTFDVLAGGPEDGEPVLLLHGFPQDHREWELVTPRLHAAGLRTYALDQRGYSPGARPATVADYRTDEAVADAVAVLDALGVESAHVVGHDWGASVGWSLAAAHPGRVRTLTAISVPHPRALADVLRSSWSQRARLGYMLVFRSPVAERLLLAGSGAALRSMMKPIGARAAGYAAAMREPGRLTAALNWYRALSFTTAGQTAAVTVPTTYVWSDGDPVVLRATAEHTAAWVSAEYRLVALRGIGHWVPEEAPQASAEIILARIRSVV